MLASLVHTPVARALGWTLVHFLWEGALIAAVLGVALFLCRPRSAKTRYALACLALLALLAAFGTTLAVMWPSTFSPAPVFRGSAVAGAQADIAMPPRPPNAADSLPWIVPLWMAGVLVFYVRMAGSWIVAQRLRGRGVVAAPCEWQERLRHLSARLRLTRPVALLESVLAETPVVIGFLRPAILMPAGLLAGLAPEQLEAILLHELAHIRRHDYAVNVLQSVVEGLLFYHPAVWWISGLVRAERENCCDDAVVALRGDARGYAVALAALEERRSVGEPALAARGGNLMKRIRRLIEPERPRSAVGPVLAAVLLLTPVAVALSAWEPQTPPRPTGAGQAAPVVTVPSRPAQPEFQQPRPAVQLAQAQPKGESQMRDQLATPYRKWLNEDVVYIINDRERAAFLALQTDQEREKFIEQFWERRDPTPGTVENEFKEEHYRRIAYANEHFASGIPGWKTDRGRIYIMYGPPDEIEAHRGGEGATYPYQQWRYRHIEGIGDNVIIEFVDTQGNGEFRMTKDPNAKGASGEKPQRQEEVQSRLAFATQPFTVVVPDGSNEATIVVPLKTPGHKFDIYGRVTTLDRRRVSVFEDTVTDAPDGGYWKRVSLKPGSYRVDIVVKDLNTGATETAEQPVIVK